MKSLRIIGVGNSAAADDGAGPAVIEELRKHPLPDGVDAVSVGADALAVIEYLEEDEIAPDSVQIFGAHLPEDILIDVESCTTDDGKWLRRPDVCRSLEERYKETLMDRYRGHVEGGGCSFEDRDRKGKGPF